MQRTWLMALLLVVACDRGQSAPTAPTVAVPSASAEASASPDARASSSATSDAPATAWTKTLPANLRPSHAKLTTSIRKGLPESSADYAEALALVMLHGRGDIDFDALKKAVVARELPAHRLGDPYLLISPPPPPPGQAFDPAIMPADWAGTWGEVAMAYLLGELSKPQYETLHQAAHPTCK